MALFLGLLLARHFTPVHAEPRKRTPPRGKELEKLAQEYGDAPDEAARREIRDRLDAEFAPLVAGSTLKGLRRSLLNIARKNAPRIQLSGTNYFYDEDKKLGKYIVKGGPSKTLFIGLHGGGVGEGDAESMAAGMGGGGWLWIFPEVLEKTELGWTTSGTEEFVLELVEAAKRTARVDPDRVYVTGHSMGGYGSWALGAHHPDVFAGVAAYAGGPSPIYRRNTDREVSSLVPGVIPNYYNTALLFFQSLDDPRVTPEANIFAHQQLLDWKEKHPGGFNFRYVEVTGRGHDPPEEGYLPTQQWVASHRRTARPTKLIWQPSVPWKRHYHWLYWEDPERAAILQAEVTEANIIDIKALRGARNLKRLTVLLGEPLVDLDEEVVVRLNGEEAFRGIVPRTLSTLLMTMSRNDEQLLFDARVDLLDKP
jgi:predicted esterase